MAIELKFGKSDPSKSWGFKLKGGADHNLPLIVTEVVKDSISEGVGLQSGDVVVRIDDTPTAGLTHKQTHDLLLASGNHLILAVRRGDILSSIPHLSNDEEDNEEVSEILRPSIEAQIICEPVLDTCAGDSRAMGDNPSAVYLAQKLTITETEITSVEETTSTTQERKWSTFLQKPHNPKPAIKKTEDAPKGEPYRVIIKKQPKRDLAIKKDVEQLETTRSEEIENIAHTVVDNNSADEGPTNASSPDVASSEDNNNDRDVNDFEDHENSVDKSSESEPEPPKLPPKEDKRSALQKSLEDKLAEVQKQLQALALLPSTIQSTLNAVTKELENIVQAKDNLENTDVQDESEQKSEINTYTEQDLSDIENDIISEHVDTEVSFISNITDEARVEKYEDDYHDSDQLNPEPAAGNDLDEEPRTGQEQDETTREPDPDEGLTDEEKEERRLERARAAKQQKDQEYADPKCRPKPIQRPIILPGGRKWSLPDDACAVVKRPKMSDDKIAGTIEMYSEVITGKTKGLTIGTRYGPGLTKPNPFTGIVPNRHQDMIHYFYRILYEHFVIV